MQKINIRFSNKSVIPALLAKQGDVGRKFQVVFDDGIPEGIDFSVWYTGSSGSGNYTKIGNRSAFTIEGNTVTVELIAQMLNNDGEGLLCLVMTGADSLQIGTWNIPYICEKRPGANSDGAKDYYNAFSEVVAAAKKFTVDKTLSKSGSPADAAETGKQIAVERARINNLATLQEGSTTGDAELADARVDYKGKIYANAGSAIRGQVGELAKAINEILNPDSIVDGGYIDDATDYYEFSGWSIVRFPATPGATYEYSGLTTVGNAPKSVFYNGETRIKIFKQAIGTNRIVAPEGADTLAFSVNNADLANFTVTKIKYASIDAFNETAQKVDGLAFKTGDFSSLLEHGYIAEDGTNGSAWTARLRFSKTVKEPFSVCVHNGFNIFAIYYYDKNTDKCVNREGLLGVGRTDFISNGEYGVRLVFYKPKFENDEIPASEIPLVFKNVILSNSEKVNILLENEEMLKQELTVERERIDRLNDIAFKPGYFSSILESGYIKSDGTTAPYAARLRFSEMVTEPFIVCTHNGFCIIGAYKYNKDTGEYIGYDWYYAKGVTEYISNGEYGVRLVFYKPGYEEVDILASEIPLVFKNPIIANSEKINRNTVGYLTLKDLPDPATAITGVIPGASAGMIWSDRSVWRWAKNNELATSARRYKTIKVSDGSTMNEKDPDTVEAVMSISKVLGSLMVVRYVSDLTQTVQIIENDVLWDGGANFVQPGDILTYDALLNTALIQSDNTAAFAISRLIGYIIKPSASTEAEARAAYAVKAAEVVAELGMTNTTGVEHPSHSLKSTATDICKLYKHIVENEPTITDIWGKLTYELSVTGANARTWTINSTTTSANREKVPEFVGGKTGSSDTEGCWGFVWRNPNDNELYITALLGFTLATGDKAQDGRQIIDEVYSLQ